MEASSFESCTHGKRAPRQLLIDLPAHEGPAGRLACPVCAYERGGEDTRRAATPIAPTTGRSLEPELQVILAKVREGAKEGALTTGQERVKRAQNAASAKGTVLSGNALHEASSIYREEIATAAVTAREQMLAAVRAVYGAVDGDHASYVQDQVVGLVDSLSKIGSSPEHLWAGRPSTLPAGALAAIQAQFDASASKLKRETEVALGPLMLRSKLSKMAKAIRTAGAATGSDFDLFISYAGEDNEGLVRPLKAALDSRGLNSWYAETQLTLGDSLAAEINDGLARSRYAVVVLSSAYLAKGWPMIELNTLVAMAATVGRKKLLPVWHGVSHAELMATVPILAGLKGQPSDVGPEQLADVIVSAVRAVA